MGNIKGGGHMLKVKLTSIIAESFYEAHKDIKQGLHTHYWLKRW